MILYNFFFLLYYSLWEHRASTNAFHRTLFWAIGFTSLHPLPPRSCCSVRLQVCFGLPTLRWPWGVQSRDCRATLFLRLNVWPMNRHFLRLICRSIGSWLHKLQRSSFRILLGQKIRHMIRRHLFMKTWILLYSCCLANQVSLPYMRTDLTQALNILSFRSLDICCERQTGHKLPNAVLASVAPPSTFIMLPR